MRLSTMSAILKSETAHRRRMIRRRVLKDGVIAYLDKHCTINCVIRDVSDNGARLRVDGVLPVPDRFVLLIAGDGTEVECEVRWRRDIDIGVLFLGPMKETGRKRRQLIASLAPTMQPRLRRRNATARTSATSSAVGGAREVLQLSIGSEADHVTCHPIQGGESRATDDLVSLLLIAHSELSRLGFLVAVSCCVANGLETPGVNPRDLIRFFPRESTDLALALDRVERRFSNSRLAASLKAVQQKIAIAKAVTIGFASDGLGANDRSCQLLKDLRQSWRLAAGTTGRTLRESSDALTILLRSDTMDTTDRLVCALDHAAMGFTPLLRPNGSVAIPEWAERRETGRVQMSCPAIAIVGQRRLRVLVRDLSTTGIGIDCAEPLLSGAAITLQIGQQLLLPGTVTWFDEGRAGIELDRALHSDDVLLAFCSRPRGDVVNALMPPPRKT